ncbi:MAG: tetratricopeptide repeat protein [Chloroflexi bacterium]|nr:tetratricopeptide repeat protein [Chloroflexota bacterium]
MADVFISYSRHNIAFARQLFAALQDGGRDSWVDWDDIPMSAEWWQSIQEGIEAANGFVFIITPDSLASPVCTLEVTHAISNHKRIIPVVHVDADIAAAYGRLAAINPSGFLEGILQGRDLLDIARRNWSVVESINWLFFRDSDNFDASVRRLIEVVETDFARVRLHTRLLLRANEWRDKTFDQSYLLSGTDLREAERWLKIDGDKPPHATEAHKAYIRASLHLEEQEAAERQRQIDELNAASKRAADEALRAERLRRRASVATVLATLLVLALTVAALVAVSQISDANQRIATATVAQGAALADVQTATVFQGQALQRADAADTQVAVAGETLAPIPGTLTQAALLRIDAENGQHILNELSAALLNVQANIGVRAQIARMDRLVDLYPDSALAYRSRGLVRTRLNDLEGALSDYDRSIELAPTFADALLSRGNLYLLLDRTADAEADFTRIIALEPNNSVAYYNRGLTLARMQEFDFALIDYNRAIQLDPDYAEAYNNRGVTHYELGIFDRAAADFERAIALGLDGEQTYRNLNLALAVLATPTVDLRTVFPVTPSPTATATLRVVRPIEQPPFAVTSTAIAPERSGRSQSANPTRDAFMLVTAGPAQATMPALPVGTSVFQIDDDIIMVTFGPAQATMEPFNP